MDRKKMLKGFWELKLLKEQSEVLRRILLKKANLKLWQLLMLLIGFVFIVLGLLMIIFWQRGFVQLKWLQCPGLEIPFA